MVARVASVAFNGIDVKDVDVQVRVANGLPAFTIVGLADKAVAESRERVRAALESMGLSLPPKRIIVNLAPADLLKEGSHFDLPIALALLAAMDVLPKEEVANFLAIGELSLDGGLSAVAGVLPAAIAAAVRGYGFICPAACGPEAAWAEGVEVLAPENLLALVNHFKGSQVLTPPRAELAESDEHYPDLADVKGQETARRALEIAAAGGHNLLMVGPPGSGKSLLAQRLAGILPPLNAREALAVSMIQSVAGALKGKRISRQRPFRSPHHSASLPALVGGGSKARPGEVSLAHYGVLFLDEFPEFSRQALEALRQPLEAGEITIARANAHVTYPARVQLIAAMNPCRCGYFGDPGQDCGRAPKCAADYQAKISGPLFDRIDLHVEVPAVSPDDLGRPAAAEPSATVRERVLAARAIATARYKKHAKADGIRLNAEADGTLLEAVAAPNHEGRALLKEAAEKMRLTARGYHRVLRVARTLADLEGSDGVLRHHIAEALSYRRIVPGRNPLLPSV